MSIFRDSEPPGKLMQMMDESEDYEMSGTMPTDQPNPCEPWPSCWNGGISTRDP